MNSTNNVTLLGEIEKFYEKFQKNEFSHLIELATALEELADQAWDIVEELYPESVQIDP